MPTRTVQRFRNGVLVETFDIEITQEEFNRSELGEKAAAALATNIAALALPDPTPGNNTYLAIVSPANAQVVAQVRALTNQNNALVAQVQALTRQNDVLIRFAATLLDSTGGT